MRFITKCALLLFSALFLATPAFAFPPVGLSDSGQPGSIIGRLVFPVSRHHYWLSLLGVLAGPQSDPHLHAGRGDEFNYTPFIVDNALFILFL